MKTNSNSRLNPTKNVFYSEHRNIADEKTTVTLSANELHTQFLNDEALATINYLDKAIEIFGEITSIENSDVILNDKLDVRFNLDVVLKFKKGELITIKGRCVGYDDLLEMVKIDQATIINN